MKGLVEWGGGCFVERESSDRPGRTTDAASFGSEHAGHRCAYTPVGAVLAAVLACRYIDEHVNEKKGGRVRGQGIHHLRARSLPSRPSRFCHVNWGYIDVIEAPGGWNHPTGFAITAASYTHVKTK